MRYLGGHLGLAVTALLDGQLDAASAERAWAHVHACAACRRQVEREGWIKTRLAAMTDDDGRPPQKLLGSLYGLSAPLPGAPDPSGAAAWAAVEEIERRGRARRRTGLLVAGAGSVAVFGLASLSVTSFGGGSMPTPPTSALTRTPVSGTPAVVAPLAHVHGRLPGAEAATATATTGEVPGGLRR